MKLAERFSKLGTETAFSVAEECQRLSATNRIIYPFHIGDINLKTPENIMEAACRAMCAGKTGYTSNYGILALREALAVDINRSHGTSYSGANVAIQPGGKPVIQKFLLALVNPGDEVLYPNPGYPIYESLIGFLGGRPVPYGYKEGPDGFHIDLQQLNSRIGSRTRLLVLNNLHNPTGAEASLKELEEIARLVLKHEMTVLCDEAYFDIRYRGKSKSLVSLPEMIDRALILYTFSKKYAMTGWRLGAAVGPVSLINALALLNVNDESCTNHFVQYAGLEALTGPQDGARAILTELNRRRDRCHELVNQIPHVHCARPDTTFYLFPNVTRVIALQHEQDYESFRRNVLRATGVSFCTRIHFGQTLCGEQERYIRLSYSGIDVERIEEGLIQLRIFVERLLDHGKRKNHEYIHHS